MMRDTFNAYTQALNRQVGRQGSLFEGRFKAIQIEDEAYLVHLCRYIHRNPVDCDPPLAEDPGQWPNSNYPEWTRQRKGALVDKAFIEMYFDSISDYREFVSDTPSLKAIQRLEKYMLD